MSNNETIEDIKNALNMVVDYYQSMENMTKNFLNKLLCSAVTVGSVINLHFILDQEPQANASSNNEQTLREVIKDKIESRIRSLVLQGAEVDTITKDDKTPLQIATYGESFHIVSILLDLGADINLETKYGIPFHLATFTGNKKLIKLFLAKGVNINARDGTGNTALHRICEYRDCESRHVKVCEYLLKFGADVNAENDDKKTPLFCSAEANNCQIVNILLQHQIDTNMEKNKLALMESLKHPKVIEDQLISEMLLEHGFTFSKADAVDVELLSNVIKNSHAKALEQMLLLGTDTETIIEVSDSNNMQQMTLIQAAVFVNVVDINIIKILVRHGANVHVKDKIGRNLLHLAVPKFNYCIIEELIDYEFDMNTGMEGGITLLHLVAVVGCSETVKLILQHNANVNCKTKFNATPLHYIAASGWCFTIKILVDNGADVNAKMHTNLTPLHVALMRGHEGSAVDLIISRDAEINSQDDFGRTPLHIAASKGLYKCIRKLLTRDARTDIKDSMGKTAYNIITEYASESLIQDTPVDLYKELNKELNGLLKHFDYKFEYVEDSDFERDSDVDHIDCETLCEYRNENEPLSKLVAVFERYDRYRENRKRILYMSKADVEKITTSGDVKKADLKLAREVMVMRNYEIGNGITLYDVLTQNYKTVAKYLLDRKMSTKLKTQKCKLTLRYYYWFLKKKIGDAEQYNLSKIVGDELNQLFNKKLPDFVIQEIMSYLKKDDLKNIFDAIYPKKVRNLPMRKCKKYRNI